jgi:hypothetical protein
MLSFFRISIPPTSSGKIVSMNSWIIRNWGLRRIPLGSNWTSSPASREKARAKFSNLTIDWPETPMSIVVSIRPYPVSLMSGVSFETSNRTWPTRRAFKKSDLKGPKEKSALRPGIFASMSIRTQARAAFLSKP